MDADSKKSELLESLHQAVKSCQKRFGGRKEIASNCTESCVNKLLNSWENVLNHGLIESSFRIGSLSGLTSIGGGLQQLSSTFSTTLTATISQLNAKLPNTGAGAGAASATGGASGGSTFWLVLKEILSSEEAARFNSEPNDRARCREWLREKINESSLERFVHTFLGRPDLLHQHYSPQAFVRDADKSAALPNLAAGINSIIFALSPQPSLQLDDEDEDCAVEVAAAACEASAAAVARPLRRPKPVVVSFDDDDAVSSAGSDFSLNWPPESGYSTAGSRSPPREIRKPSASASASSRIAPSSSTSSLPSNQAGVPSNSTAAAGASGLGIAELRQAVADVSRAREREAAERRRAQDECRRLQAKLQQLQRDNSLLCKEVGKEERLARLAEMHADVSELNSQLQVSLLHAQRELELLRGPSPRCADHPLYVSIVAAFKRGAGPTRHHVYQLHCRTPSIEWCAFRRYQQFLDYHEAASRQYPDIRDFYFPPKERHSLREEVVRKRRHTLQLYVRDVVNYLSTAVPQFTHEAAIRQHCPLLLLEAEAVEPALSP